MPSDPRLPAVRERLAAPWEGFRQVIEATVLDVRDYLVSASFAENGRVERLSTELGPLGAELIDVERFAALFAEPEVLDRMTAETVEQALNTLAGMSRRDDDLFLAEVPAGGSLRETIARALADIGRVFGAARIVEQIRARRYRYADHGRSLGSFPFRQWTRAERRLVPPLVVTVDGGDLHAIELAEFLDGTIKLILLVGGTAPPASLVRLITPQAFIGQSLDPVDVDRLLGWEGAGVLALMPDMAAGFLHDPRGGPELWDRLTLSRMPEQEPRKSVGSVSAAQQADELRQLVALSRRPAPQGAPAVRGGDVPKATPSASEPAAPADKLAAWLLSQADLSGTD